MHTIRRPRGPRPTLRHLELFEALADAPAFTGEAETVADELRTRWVGDAVVDAGTPGAALPADGPLHIGACVEGPRLDRLRAALGERHHLHVALGCDAVEQLLRHEPIDVMLVDPLVRINADGGTTIDAVTAIQKIRQTFPSVPVVLYSALTPQASAAMAELGRNGIDTAILQDVDDGAAELRRLLARQPGVALSQALLAALEPQLRRMPGAVAQAVERLVHTPAAFHDVPDLAEAAGVSRRTMYRECERAGLASPREVIAAARVLRAYALLREANYGIEDTAAALRFSSPHHLARAMRWACGTTTARARAQVPPDAFVARLAARLVPTTPTASSS